VADRREDVARIGDALDAAGVVLERFRAGGEEVAWKGHDDPVTAADLAVDRAIREILPRAGEGWLSEETEDDAARLDADRVWVVDPIDGTKEFVRAVPEWVVSIGLIEDRRPVAGGILNPATGERVVGSIETGVTLDGRPVTVSTRSDLEGAVVLASRSESARGEWDRFRGAGFEIRPTGSVAYKLALVAAGKADATWTLTPKHEWDVAAGAALVVAAGGRVWQPGGGPLRFNAARPRLTGMAASGPGLADAVAATIAPVA